MINGDYILVKAPDDYPGKKYRNKYVYEHHLVWWEKTRCVLKHGYNIHHKNGNKHDNRFENLEVLSISEHASHHGKLQVKGLTEISCSFCNNKFLRETRNYKISIKNGQNNFFCCRSHQITYQQKQIKIKNGFNINEHNRNMYRKGCRCNLCKADNAKRQKEYRLKKWENGREDYCSALEKRQV